MKRAPMQWFLSSCLLLLASLFGGCSRPVPALAGDAERTEPWNAEVVERLAAVPVQDNGRVKPLSVLAAFLLYDVHGRRDLKYSLPGEDGRPRKVTLSPTEWFLDVICYPRQAANYPLFRIENVAVMSALGIENDGQRQDFEYLTFEQVWAAVDKLQPLVQSYRQIPASKRDEVQEHVLQLWRRFLAYDRVQRQFTVFHFPVAITEPELQERLGGERVTFGQLVAKAATLRALASELGPELENASQNTVRLFDFLSKATKNDEDGVGVLAPPSQEQAVWLTFGQALNAALTGRTGEFVTAIQALQRACSADSHADTERELLAFATAANAAANGHADFDQIERETTYYQALYAYQSIHWFLFAFLLAALSWLVPRSRRRWWRWLWWAAIGVTVYALALLGYDITLRCLITGRPPIKNLYDTFLFIAAVGVLASLVAEWVIPRRIALGVGPALGALVVMLARLFEVNKGTDTMDPLMAVLDSNFWLATHVTTINIGYAAGMFAAGTAHAWVIRRLLPGVSADDTISKAIVRITYGLTAFGLTFAVVGTILGGIWANDSWGRFWGWDPKENGALMICLSQIALLHARMCGWVRDLGFIVWSMVTGMVVVFSWFHVNQLGVGLHSYGFTAGIREWIWGYYYEQTAFVGLAFLTLLRRRTPAVAAAAVAGE